MKWYLVSAMMLMAVSMRLYSQESFIATGFSVSESGGSLSVSVGQTGYIVMGGSNGFMVAGVQQPYEISSTTGTENPFGISFTAQIYPNPVNASFVLKVTGNPQPIHGLAYQLVDLQGKTMINMKMASPETVVDCNNLPPAVYFLKVCDAKTLLRSFVIIKK